MDAVCEVGHSGQRGGVGEGVGGEGKLAASGVGGDDSGLTCSEVGRCYPLRTGRVVILDSGDDVGTVLPAGEDKGTDIIGKGEGEEGQGEDD